MKKDSIALLLSLSRKKALNGVVLAQLLKNMRNRIILVLIVK
jgi:hypothetical protein